MRHRSPTGRRDEAVRARRLEAFRSEKTPIDPRDPKTSEDAAYARMLEKRRAAWRYRGDERPAFAETPGPGQRSVWDFPRPPAIEAEPREVEVFDGDVLVARSRRAVRVLETASPPTVYIPPEDVVDGALAPISGESFCEWKGRAGYLCLASRTILGAVAWRIEAPLPGFETLTGWIAFYASRLDCRLGGERVTPQPGAFYGGWVTSELVGPFKGAPGSEGW